MTRAVSTQSPEIERIVWGVTKVAGLGTFRDVKLWPGGGREWDWTEHNTHHVPGIQPGDVQELLDHGCEIVVLTKGMHLVLQTAPETMQLLKERGIEVHHAETKEACAIYNRLAREGARVGALVHSTC